ncbi:MAG: 16S rRNA (cytosine(1402)-N(4))-methyltransferase RsmH [candidate division Zixibacteria bacterium]|nr:16S rRNA (cytosine(1402)-N(4))-methyltransferase RsmH [candidate division Zixibacteria bacterium]
MWWTKNEESGVRDSWCNVKIMHKPVLLEEVLENLLISKSGIYFDATVGTGGHAEAIVSHLDPEGKLICMDRDESLLEIAKKRLDKYKDKVEFGHFCFSQIKDFVLALKIKEISGFLFDLGVCSLHLDDPQRGFSFQSDGPLDMRMDPSQSKTASFVVNNYSLSDLTKILFEFGQERFSKRIAGAIVREREKKQISTTFELRKLVESKVNPRYRIKSLARVFQAIRIEVNDELEELRKGLDQAIQLLAPQGRLCVLGYHSLEHQIVKERMKIKSKETLRMITKKPIVPSAQEIKDNPRARSAKLWVAEKLSS